MGRRSEKAKADAFIRKYPEFEEEPTKPLRFNGQRVLLTADEVSHGSPWPPKGTKSPRSKLVQELIDKALDLLQPKHRDLLRMVYDECLTQAEIGQKLGISQQAAQQRVKTARRKLRKACLEVDPLLVRQLLQGEEGGEI